jgi:hypothetical protein
LRGACDDTVTATAASVTNAIIPARKWTRVAIAMARG